MAIEGLGEAVTGGMLARAVEPEAGESHETGEGACLNCGAPRAGLRSHHFHRFGSRTDKRDRSLGDSMRELCVLSQEAITGVYRVRLGALCRIDDR